MFEEAADNSPSIILIDEFEAFVPTRALLGYNQEYKSEEVNEMLTRLESCGEKGILVIAATNEPFRIDPAVLRTGRLDKHIYIGPPDNLARRELLEFYLSMRPCDGGVDLNQLAASLEGYSASDIRFLVDNLSSKVSFNSSTISSPYRLRTLIKVVQ